MEKRVRRKCAGNEFAPLKDVSEGEGRIEHAHFHQVRNEDELRFGDHRWARNGKTIEAIFVYIQTETADAAELLLRDRQGFGWRADKPDHVARENFGIGARMKQTWSTPNCGTERGSVSRRAIANQNAQGYPWRLDCEHAAGSQTRGPNQQSPAITSTNGKPRVAIRTRVCDPQRVSQSRRHGNSPVHSDFAIALRLTEPRSVPQFGVLHVMFQFAHPISKIFNARRDRVYPQPPAENPCRSRNKQLRRVRRPV